MNKLYEMTEGSTMSIDTPMVGYYSEVLRVPGGWIYIFEKEYDGPGDRDFRRMMSTCFVPFNEEFKQS